LLSRRVGLALARAFARASRRADTTRCCIDIIYRRRLHAAERSSTVAQERSEITAKALREGLRTLRPNEGLGYGVFATAACYAASGAFD
jgi:hypothetical protein